MATDFLVMLFAANVGVTLGGVIGSLLSFVGVMAGANLIAAGVLMADDPAAFGGARALAGLLRHHLTVVGLVVASCAVMAVSGEADPVLCFGMFAVLLLVLALIIVGVLGK